MALSKEIELPSGIAVRYHRVVRVDGMTNSHTAIEVASYTSQEKREEERAALAAGEPMDVYVHGALHVAPWSEGGMSTAEAYEWLKANAADFADAADVLED